MRRWLRPVVSLPLPTCRLRELSKPLAPLNVLANRSPIGRRAENLWTATTTCPVQDLRGTAAWLITKLS